MKISIYELLGMIKDDKAPKKIMYLCDIYELHTINEYTYYKNGTTPLLITTNSINDTVEILEEEKKIPEKITMCTSGIMGFDGVENITTELKDKVNEIIDTLEILNGKIK